MRRALAAAVVVAAAVAAAPAHATLVYVKNATSQKYKPSVWVGSDGSSGEPARRLATGNNPHISPDGATVAYATVPTAPKYVQKLVVIPTAGGTARTLSSSLYDTFNIKFSPDSKWLAAVIGDGKTASKLILYDLVNGTARTVAKGDFAGLSFSPDSSMLAYGGSSKIYTAYDTGNVYVAPTTTAGAPLALTTDSRSIEPVWGPNQIVYTRIQRRTRDAPIYNLSLMNPDGTGPTKLTNDKVPSLLSGLVATAWSGDGTHLLTQFGGQDTSYAVTVDPVSGKEHVLGKKTELGYFATALSKDGQTVLAQTGGFDPVLNPNVVTLPYGGGSPTILVKHATSPDWTR